MPFSSSNFSALPTVVLCWDKRVALTFFKVALTKMKMAVPIFKMALTM